MDTEPWKISGDGLNIFQGNRLLCTCQNEVQAMQTVDAHEVDCKKAYEFGYLTSEIGTHSDG